MKPKWSPTDGTSGGGGGGTPTTGSGAPGAAGAQPTGETPTGSDGQQQGSAPQPPATPQGDQQQGDDYRQLRAAIEAERKLRSAAEAEIKRRDAEAKARADAELPEVERLRKENERLAGVVKDAQDRDQQRTTNDALVDAARTLGFRNPALAPRLVDPAAVTRDADGKVTNADALLKAALDADPYLRAPDQDFGGGRRSGQPQGTPLSLDQAVEAHYAGKK